ncbi:MAG: hypothetical protein N2049_11345 [Anaerolineales bacterium]|nr:hypothetical protein [Anaerolineales bacterium]MCX7609792.1 hypothetical protein [Anaerolineales bacterium]MDW8228007.1 hypothetical protein [Anaerolineales bacterium]
MSRREIFRRIGWAMLLGLLIGVFVNEVTFALLRESSRAPQTIELVIPRGTAEMIARGEQPPSLPSYMTFVAGDVLVIRNQDRVAHQMGPLWIPAFSEARLNIATTGSYTNACSFQTTNAFNFDVREPLTTWTRLRGILMSGVPLGILLALYAIVAWPERKKNRT